MKSRNKQNTPPEAPSGGIIFLNKPTGFTSFQALGRIKKVLGTRKVGHTGTLDKFAEGLLILLSGKFTRLNAMITGMDKEYVALIRFGRETDTLDPEGDTVAEAQAPDLETIRERLNGFLGVISQIPPVYSAVHVDGQRAHKMARRGEEVQMPSREIRIDELEILDYNCPDLRLRICCSKGTYIRSLARDLGKACGSRAYVQELVRTAVGPFRVEDAVRPEDFNGPSDFQSWESFFSVLEGTEVAQLNETAIEKMRHGVPFRDSFLETSLKGEAGMLLLKDAEGELKAVVEKAGGEYRYKINLCT